MKSLTCQCDGLERVVWRHPQYRERVIKVMKPSARINRNKSDLDWLHRQAPVISEHLPVLYNFTESNFGLGLECELIQDANGQPSKSLVEYVKNGELDEAEAQQLLRALYDWAIRNHILISDSQLGSVLYQRHGRERLVIVDGFGPGHGIYLSVVKRFRLLIRYSNVRKRRRALRNLARIATKQRPQVEAFA